MRRALDYARQVLISPEVFFFLLPFGLYRFTPDPFIFMAAQIASDLKWGFGVALSPVVLLGFSYNLGTEVLSPSGARKVLLEWPDYWMLKSRVLASLGFCIFGVAVGILGFYLVAQRTSPLGAVIMTGGCVISAAALATLALAKWKAREILGE